MVRKKMRNNKPATKNLPLNNKEQEKQDKIKAIWKLPLTIWNDWKFQIYWEKLEYVMPIKKDKEKPPSVCILTSSLWNLV